VGISIDGIGQMHDMIRGIPGAFDKALATLQAMQNLGIKNIRIGFTISNTNLNHLGKVYNLALEQGVDFGCAVAQNSELYFKTNNNSGIEDLPRLEEQFNYIISRQLRTANPKQWARAFFNYGTYQFSCGVGRLFDCKAGTDFFYMDPDGNIYPCNIMNKKMGNIRASDFNSIWNSQTSSDVRSLVAGCGKNCWMICTARTAIKKNFLKVGNWIVQNKIRSHLFNGKGIF
jgi:radical SAM protein with 4Fe4S-binding SPASM domain